MKKGAEKKLNPAFINKIKQKKQKLIDNKTVINKIK